MSETSQNGKFNIHNIDSIVAEHTRVGYVAFDTKKCLLCYNKAALRFVPELAGKPIDACFGSNDSRLVNVFYALLEQYESNGIKEKDYTLEKFHFRCYISPFSLREGGSMAGYLVEMQDITAEHGYMNLITEYGQFLENAVREKTEHIQQIQQRVLLGLAGIIENRDMNTGGHVKRTSEIIRIIVEEMQKQNVVRIDNSFAEEIIRSAPMHDLGKIFIENSILNKPDKLNEAEYKIMQTHAVKSGEIVRIILEGVEEPHFVQTAYCLARFHHERWDGKGYPEHLAQIEIPLEARIMAVADVYDALINKRCYKEPLSFAKAAEIMLEGMGSQFDPMMKQIFLGCREKLEQYYRDHNEE